MRHNSFNTFLLSDKCVRHCDSGVAPLDPHPALLSVARLTGLDHTDGSPCLPASSVIWPVRVLAGDQMEKNWGQVPIRRDPWFPPRQPALPNSLSHRVPGPLPALISLGLSSNNSTAVPRFLQCDGSYTQLHTSLKRAFVKNLSRAPLLSSESLMQALCQELGNKVINKKVLCCSHEVLTVTIITKTLISSYHLLDTHHMPTSREIIPLRLVQLWYLFCKWKTLKLRNTKLT